MSPNRKTNSLWTALGEFSTNFPHLIAAFRLTWQAAKGWTSAWVCLLVVQGLLPVAIVHLTRLLVDALAAATGGGLAFANSGKLAIDMGADACAVDADDAVRLGGQLVGLTRD